MRSCRLTDRTLDWGRLALRTVRIVDRGSAQQHGLEPVPRTDVRRRDEDEPGKPSVDAKRFYYQNGPGWVAAYNEARRLMATGLPVERAASQVGWSTDELKAAISRNGKPPEIHQDSADEFRPRERARRTVKQRVAGLQGVSQKVQKLARRLYEVEIMTVREVAKALGEPYEKTYLILILAGTKFRRPGRRGGSDTAESGSSAVFPADDAAEDIEKVAEDDVVVAKPTKRRPRKKPAAVKKVVRVRTVSSPGKLSDAEKALRRVLGLAAPSRTRGDAGRGSDHRVDRKLSEKEKALRRVLGR